jgi:hypothetical protein
MLTLLFLLRSSQSGTGEIAIAQGNNRQVLASNVNLSSGRVEITVPANLQQGQSYVVTSQSCFSLSLSL